MFFNRFAEVEDPAFVKQSVLTTTEKDAALDKPGHGASTFCRIFALASTSRLFSAWSKDNITNLQYSNATLFAQGKDQDETRISQ